MQNTIQIIANDKPYIDQTIIILGHFDNIIQS